jgi:GNAT superfamily N-acetyltransferase
MNITYVNSITAEDYTALRKSAGWKYIHPEQAAAGLEGSAFIVAAKDGLKTIGTARLIWDSGYSAYITDVVVFPDYRGQGIGTEMMNRILEFLRSKMKPGFKIAVYLLAAKDKEPFYEKFGFVARPYENRGAGMDLWLTNE